MSKETVMTPEENDSESSKPNFFSTPKSEHTKSDCCGCVRWSSSKKSFKTVYKENSVKKKLIFEDMELEITPQKQNLKDIFQEEEDEDKTWDNYSVSSQTGSFDGVEECIQLYLNQKEKEKLKKEEDILQNTHLNKMLNNLTKLFPEPSSHITKSIHDSIPPDIIINNKTDNIIENHEVEDVLIESSSSIPSLLLYDDDYHSDYNLKYNNDDIINDNNNQEKGINIDNEDDCIACDCELCEPHFSGLMSSRMLYNSPVSSPYQHSHKEHPMLNNYKLHDKVINKNYKKVNRLTNINYNNLYNVYGFNEEMFSTHHNTLIKHSPSQRKKHHTYETHNVKHTNHSKMHRTPPPVTQFPYHASRGVHNKGGGNLTQHDHRPTSGQGLNRPCPRSERLGNINTDIDTKKGMHKKKKLYSKKHSNKHKPTHASMHSYLCDQIHEKPKEDHNMNLEDVIQDLCIQTKNNVNNNDDESNGSSGKNNINNNLYNTEEEPNDNGSFIINNDEINEDSNNGDDNDSCVINEEEEEEEDYIINCYGRVHNNTIESHYVKKVSVVPCCDEVCYENNNKKNKDKNKSMKHDSTKIKVNKHKFSNRVLRKENDLDHENLQPIRHQHCFFDHYHHPRQQHNVHPAKQHYNKNIHTQHYNNNQVNAKTHKHTHMNTNKNIKIPIHYSRNTHKEKEAYPYAHSDINTHTNKYISSNAKKGANKNTQEMSRRVVRRRLCRISKYIRKKNKKINNKSGSSSSSSNSKNNNNNNSASVTSSSSHRSFDVTTLAQI